MKTIRLLIVLVAVFAVDIAAAQEKSARVTAAKLFPEDSVIYLEMPHPDRLVDTLLKHPLVEFAQTIPDVKKAMSGPQFNVGMGFVKSVEIQIEMSWQEALKSLTQGGIYFAFDPVSEGVCLLVQAKDTEVLEKVVSTLLRIGKDFGRELPTTEFAGVTVYKADKVGFATIDRWLVVANREGIAVPVLKGLKNGEMPESSLSGNKVFTTARKSFSEDSIINGFLNIEFLRNAGVAPDLYAGITNNIAVELLIGGLLSNLQKTSHLAFHASLSNEEIGLSVTSPHQADWSAPREYFYGDGEPGLAPPMLSSPDTIFTLSAYRNLSEMWLRSGDLLTERGQDELAEADSTLSTFFAGRDFGEDILGSLSPQLQLVVNRQDFSKADYKPTLRLPSFALIAPMSRPEVANEFRRIFQSLIGFLNVVGAMEGNPQLDMDSERLPNGRLLHSSFVPDVDEATNDDAPVQYNFTPSVALLEKRMTISSSKSLAEQTTGDMAIQPVPAGANTAMHLNADLLSKILGDNRDQLIANNMLEKGHGREAAEKEIDGLFLVLSLLKSANLNLNQANDSLNLNFNIRLAEPSK